MKTPPNPRLKIIKKTWKQLGFSIRPTKYRIIVRTEPVAKKIGKEQIIWLPEKLQTHSGALPHLQLITGTVLSVGPDVPYLKPGDHIGFSRLFFGWFYKVDAFKPDEDGKIEQERVGYIDCNQVAGLVDLSKYQWEQ